MVVATKDCLIQFKWNNLHKQMHLPYYKMYQKDNTKDTFALFLKKKDYLSVIRDRKGPRPTVMSKNVTLQEKK